MIKGDSLGGCHHRLEGGHAAGKMFLTALPAIFLVIVALSMEALLVPTSS